MKKKLFSAGLAALLVLSVPGVTMAADNQTTIQTKDGTAEHDVYAAYAPIAEADIVYSVDIKWGSMEFTYTAPTLTRTWNPQTHKYEETTSTKGTWTSEEDANKVTLTNRSNAALTATIAAEMLKDGSYDYTQIKASIVSETLQLADASAGATTKKPGTADEKSATISLVGELTNKEANKTPIGNITVTIKDAKEETQP